MDSWSSVNLKEFKVSQARKIAKENEYDRIIVLYTNKYEDTYEYAVTTYGETKEKCKSTGKIGEELAEGLNYFLHKEINDNDNN